MKTVMINNHRCTCPFCKTNILLEGWYDRTETEISIIAYCHKTLHTSVYSSDKPFKIITPTPLGLAAQRYKNEEQI